MANVVVCYVLLVKWRMLFVTRYLLGSACCLFDVTCVNCFKSTGVEEVCVPDCVHWLCDRYLKGCLSLRCVTFGPSS